MVARSFMVGLTAFVVALGSSTLSAEARTCRSTISGTGHWTQTKWGARSTARRAWAARVRKIYGSRYATWLLARNRRYVCWEQGSRDRCRALARPCRRWR